MSSLAVRDPGGPDRHDEGTRAPLLAELLAPPADRRRRVIADLCALQPGVIDAVAGTRTRLVVLDLPERRARASTRWHRLDTGLAADHWREPLDAVLCWDLLNYLEADELAELAGAISARSAPHCRIHALIQYSAVDMPTEPGRMQLDADRSLLPAPGDASEAPRRSAPRYSPKALEKAMPALRVDRTMLLGNGMQEFVFVPSART